MKSSEKAALYDKMAEALNVPDTALPQTLMALAQRAQREIFTVTITANSLGQVETLSTSLPVEDRKSYAVLADVLMAAARQVQQKVFEYVDESTTKEGNIHPGGMESGIGGSEEEAIRSGKPDGFSGGMSGGTEGHSEPGAASD